MSYSHVTCLFKTAIQLWMRVVGAKNTEKKIKQLDDNTQAY